LADGHGGCTQCPPTHDLAHLPSRPAAVAPFDATTLRDPATLTSAPDPGLADYAAALARERAGDATAARKLYYGIIANRPQSAFVPGAYLGFGEMFLSEAAQDPTKYPLAQASFEKVVTVPPPRNVLYVYAWYELGRVFQGTSDFARSLDAFRKVTDAGASFPALPSAAALADAARHELILSYAQAGAPDQAYAFFRRASGDPPGSNHATLDMLMTLGLEYESTGHYPEAVVLFRSVAARFSDVACTAMTRARESACAMHASDPDFIKRTCPDMVTNGP
jgi:tetratricopeptide (TPR) repeat protein